MGRQRRFLVSGWFSFDEVVATVGDVLVGDLVCDWLDEAGHAHDLALAPFMDGGVDWRRVDADAYTDLVFACGPFMANELLDELCQRFAHCRLIGVNVSLLDEADRARFDVLLERDSARTARADVSFLARPRIAPVIGLALAPPQNEYGGEQEAVAERVVGLVRALRLPAIDVDTDLFGNEDRPRAPEQVESLVARTDAVVTSRLHGLVLALKNGVPAVAIDAVRGGAKMSRQAEAIGWPLLLHADDVTQASLADALDRCLSGALGAAVKRCAAAGRTQAEQTRREFLAVAAEVPAHAAR